MKAGGIDETRTHIFRVQNPDGSTTDWFCSRGQMIANNENMERKRRSADPQGGFLGGFPFTVAPPKNDDKVKKEEETKKPE